MAQLALRKQDMETKEHKAKADVAKTEHKEKELSILSQKEILKKKEKQSLSFKVLV